MADGAIGEHRMRRAGHAAEPSRLFERHRAGQRADAVRLQVGGGVDRRDAGQRVAAAGIDAGDCRSGVRAAQDDAVQHARQLDVVGVATVAFEQPGSSTRRTGWARPNLVMTGGLRLVAGLRRRMHRRREAKWRGAVWPAGDQFVSTDPNENRRARRDSWIVMPANHSHSRFHAWALIPNAVEVD